MSLFDGEAEGPKGTLRTAPLAERMRPRTQHATTTKNDRHERLVGRKGAQARRSGELGEK